VGSTIKRVPTSLVILYFCQFFFSLSLQIDEIERIINGKYLNSLGIIISISSKKKRDKNHLTNKKNYLTLNANTIIPQSMKTTTHTYYITFMVLVQKIHSSLHDRGQMVKQ